MKPAAASAPGNLFFMGEHAVVYGHPALCAAVGLRTTVTVAPAEEVALESAAFGKATATLAHGKLVNLYAEKKEMAPLLRLCQQLSLRYGFGEGFCARIHSDIPAQSGLSSSTAVLCALLRALDEAFGWRVPLQDYFDLLLPVQAGIHGGKASGAELASSALGGYHRVQKKGERLEHEQVTDIPLQVVVGDTGVRAPTALTVTSHIPSLIKRFPRKVESAFEEIAALVRQGEEALVAADAPRLGALMNQNHALLVSLGLSHPKIEDCVQEALAAGALGAKLSGGGWGGVMFALVEQDTRQRVCQAIQATGSRAIPTVLGGEGARQENAQKEDRPC